ncbi:glycosyltransferase [Pontibacter chinhatensis]|uniref:Glycosyltransferase involved in cell wall bisynthesis n=1 Tax=Pontibacter chinhatensis TaxID=1436961 RepID=A0A1I2QYK3_9BACT|nr:glycosyltransferase [Pontibacter chinhatensis]SFG32813.1 Glycosyltransferase involved in cell wall bisynthesis [Pontibacter chinhatensis]
MKVIQLVQKPQLRGAEIFASQLSNHLEDAGLNVHLVSIFSGPSELPFKGKITHLDRPLAKRLWDFNAWRRLAYIIKTEKPDLIQANAGDTLKFAILSKLFYKWNTPVVFRNANKMGDFINSKPKYLLNSFFVKYVDAVVSVSHLCEKDFVETFKFPASKIKTIPIGVENLEIPSEPPADLREVFDNYRVLVNIGSLVPEKNHDALLKIFEAVAQNDPSIFLIIIGDGHLRAELERKVAELPNKERILFAGYRNDVLQVVKHATAFIMPSLIEGLPGVILEAMYCQTPVIANNVGGISEVVNKDTGWLIEKDNLVEFIKAVTEVLAGGVGVSLKTANAHRLITEEYMNTQISIKFKKVYERVIAGNNLS